MQMYDMEVLFMTIKRRLVISNILMIVIPMTVALAIVVCGMAVTRSLVNQVKDSKQNFNLSLEEMDDLAIDSISSNKNSSELQSVLNENNMNLLIYNDKGKKYEFGSTALEYRDALLKALVTVGDKGVVTINNEEAYKEIVTSGGIEYTICRMYIVGDYGLDYEDAINSRFTIVIGITIIGAILAIIIANRLLTHFVFRKIKLSLDMFAGGVHEISAGNLEHRIVYEGDDEFTPVCDDFNYMAVQLKQSVELTQKQDQSRKELLAGISHDLRSPLTSIKAYVEGLLDGVAKTPEAQTNYMRIIKTKADDIDRMVSKLFLFSKMDLGDYPYYPEQLDLGKEITSFVDAMDEEYKANGLKVSIEYMEPGITVYADPVQIRSIFANILENSLKYKDKSKTTSSIFVQQYEDKVQIVIQDNGPGVPDEALDKLFDVFYRSDPSRSNPNKGSGLGLAIVAKAVSKMGGKICAENLEQGGLKMVIELPILKKEEEEYEKDTDH
jgi:signal transduction histidine kinase